MRVAIVWQRFLPYHVARIKRLRERLEEAGHALVAVEVASRDDTYRFPEREAKGEGFEYRCCFPGESYHRRPPGEILAAVHSVLAAARPGVVLAPATPFPEGMAAVRYRLAETGARCVLMDDAWEKSDRRGPLTKAVKRLIHRNVDAAFVPAPSHLAYYRGLGFPEERVFFGVDAVDNDWYGEASRKARENGKMLKAARGAGERFFLYVGRFHRNKGLDTLVESYAGYRAAAGADPWGLVLVGPGDFGDVRAGAVPEGVQVAGPAFGEELGAWYGLASAFVLPSRSEPWGLVVNEAMAAGLPVIVSDACGCAPSLVRAGRNGWTFASDDVAGLARLMGEMASLSPGERERMGGESREIVSRWSLERFAAGAVEAVGVSRREPGGLLSNQVVRRWKGKVGRV